MIEIPSGKLKRQCTSQRLPSHVLLACDFDPCNWTYSVVHRPPPVVAGCVYGKTSVNLWWVAQSRKEMWVWWSLPSTKGAISFNFAAETMKGRHCPSSSIVFAARSKSFQSAIVCYIYLAVVWHSEWILAVVQGPSTNYHNMFESYMVKLP